ncbi:M23 family metallopeptidase [Streptomyces sp. NPDC095613]|uniref:M23 family metallopeptidase n=1 Tax=Streptomyces sp. NPDC095613 TaxID=3155540 RepID=UPI00332AEC66
MPAHKLMMTGYRLSWLVFCVLVVVGAHWELPFAWGWIWTPAVIAVALVIVMGRGARARHAVRPPAVEVAAPVTGRWSALNSPADKVPSHGTYGYGQAYAIDIVAEPEGESGPDPAAATAGEAGAEAGSAPEGEPGPGRVSGGGVVPGGARPSFAALWPVVRRNRDFPAFGAPLLAVADATVVHAEDRQRDHLSRNSLPALLYLLAIEGFVREMLGARRVTGNHLVLDLGNGTYALYAHLRRGSLAVGMGDRVKAGQVVAQCGNSGNSTEPHVHFQLMDHVDPDAARGIPFRWRGIGVPAGGEYFTVVPPAEKVDAGAE